MVSSRVAGTLVTFFGIATASAVAQQATTPPAEQAPEHSHRVPRAVAVRPHQAEQLPVRSATDLLSHRRPDRLASTPKRPRCCPAVRQSTLVWIS